MIQLYPLKVNRKGNISKKINIKTKMLISIINGAYPAYGKNTFTLPKEYFS